MGILSFECFDKVFCINVVFSQAVNDENGGGGDHLEGFHVQDSA